MCGKCYSYIYDLIVTPLSMNHLLRGYINEKALKRCSHDIAKCVSRALSKYITDVEVIHCMKLFKDAYEKNIKFLDMIQKIEFPDNSKEHTFDEFMWNKFKETNGEGFKELNHAIQLCMDNMVVKKIQSKEQIIQRFFMHKLRILLNVLPDIHKEHTEKTGGYNGKSLGSVPLYRINQIRRNAGLKVDDHICIAILEYDELYD